MSAGIATKPYKGPESYHAEDAGLFFGREDEAAQLLAKIVSSRFTLLHAQSGAGKTSLLNARIIPGLEIRGWMPVRATPHDDPVDSIRMAVLQTLFPPLTVERELIVEAREALGGEHPDVSIGDVIAQYDALASRHPLHRQLVRPRTAAFGSGSTLAVETAFTPLFSRVLRGSMDLAAFVDHLRVLRALCGSASPKLPRLDPASSINVLFDAVENMIGAETDRCILDAVDAPTPDLRAFFENLDAVYGRQRSRFGLILVLDQFEEMFTRFVDPGSAMQEVASSSGDWRLRWELFNQLQRMYGSPEDPEQLQLRYVISMRDEYIAQLDPLRQFVRDLDACAYHLTLLTKDTAHYAIREPARLFGYQYSDLCFRQIIKGLTKEERFVEPTHLQIVCDALWVRRGRTLSEGSSGDSDDLPAIDIEELAQLNGVPGILRAFFRSVLDRLSPEWRVEALDMLELLVTSSGTRNIVQRNELLYPRFRKAVVREAALAHLERHTIVRIEARLGGQFAEVTHEFLIGPILEAIKAEVTASPETSQFKYALRLLGMFEGVAVRGPQAQLLSRQEFNTLDKFRSRVRWDPWAIELMFRSAVAGGVDNDVLKRWADTYEQSSDEAGPAVPFKPNDEESLATLAVLRPVGDGVADISVDVAAVGLRSVLRFASDYERSEIIRWARRVADGKNV